MQENAPIITPKRVIVAIVILFLLSMVGLYIYTLGIINYGWPYEERFRFMYSWVTGAPGSFHSLQEDEAIVYLTWVDDPTSTMTVQWVSKSNPTGLLQYREKGEEEWNSQEADAVHEMPAAEDNLIHWNTITGLNEATTYEFKLEEDPEIRSFRTMPREPDHNIKLAFAGDSREFSYWFEDVNEQIGEYSPDVLVGKGDYVACEGLASSRNTRKWLYFLKALEKDLVDEEGHMIPYILAQGNHEVDPGWPENGDYNEPEDARYMWNIFKSPRMLGPEDEFYGNLEFGDYLQLLILDSAHTAPTVGTQDEWLEATIDEEKTHVIPVYHSAVFPTNKYFFEDWKKDMRQEWLPTFYEHGVRIVMEACDHTYKQTVPIEYAEQLPEGEENYVSLDDGYLFEGDSGMRFWGDGGWGVGIREVYNPATTWYLEKAIGWQMVRGINVDDGEQSPAEQHPDDEEKAENKEDAYHFLGVELEGDKAIVKSINSAGEVFREEVYKEKWLRN